MCIAETALPIRELIDARGVEEVEGVLRQVEEVEQERDGRVQAAEEAEQPRPGQPRVVAGHLQAATRRTRPRTG